MITRHRESSHGPVPSPSAGPRPAHSARPACLTARAGALGVPRRKPGDGAPLINLDAPAAPATRYGATSPDQCSIVVEHGDPCPPVTAAPQATEWCAGCKREHQPRERPRACPVCRVVTARWCCAAPRPVAS